MKVHNILGAVAISGASILFAGGAFAADPSGVYSLTVCGGSIQGMAILGQDRSVTIIDSNDAGADTSALGIWDKNGLNISGKAVFFRDGIPAPIQLSISNGVYDNQAGTIKATLTITPPVGPATVCPDLSMTPYI